MEIKPAPTRSILTAYKCGQETLSTLRNILRRDHIRDASRKALHQSLRGDTMIFCLNKQVAFAGHISFSEAESESPLGPIKVTVKVEDPLQLIDWLAPRTPKP